MTSGPVLEVRTYKLAPNARPVFDEIFRTGALPMLRRFGIDVVAFGPSAESDDEYLLMRAFASVAHRRRELDAFYGSDEWRAQYEPVVMPLIESFHTVVVPLPARVDAAS